MYLLARWDNLCSDSFWIYSLFAWFASVQKPLTASKTTGVQLRLLRKALMCEVLSINDNGNTLVSGEKGDLIATLSLVQANQPDMGTSVSGQSFTIRPSDISLIENCPLAFCFLIMDNAYHADRRFARTVSIHHVLDVKSSLKVGDEVKVEVVNRKDLNTISLRLITARDNRFIASCEVQVYGEGAEVPRYDKTRVLQSSRYEQQLAADTINDMGADVITTLPVTWHECSCSSAYSVGLLHFADIASALAWDMVLPLTGPFFTQTAEQDGKRQFICMYRGVVCQVFSWPRKDATIKCNTWVAKTGNSTFDLRCDFRDEDTNAPLATLQFTMVIVDRIKMKSSPVFHTKEWAEHRFSQAFKTCLPADVAPPAILRTGLPVEIPFFEYELDLRHSDQDQNGHVNSGKYMDLVHDCRFAALQTGFFSSNVQQLVEREGWIRRFGVDYLLELKMSEDKPRIRLRYVDLHSDGQQGALLVFEFVVGQQNALVTRVWVETTINHDSYLQFPSSKEIGSRRGLNPDHWGLALKTANANVNAAAIRPAVRQSASL